MRPPGTVHCPKEAFSHSVGIVEAADSRAQATPVRASWPFVGRAQRPLLAASVLVVIGSVLPWVSTPFLNLAGYRGAGLWTLYAGFVGVSGALVRWRRIAIAQAALMGAVAVVLPLWQLLRIIDLSLATDSVGKLAPGMGLVMVLGAGVWSLVCAWRLLTQE